MFEAQWRELAGAYNELKATAEVNEGRNCFHTEIACGCIVLTESAVKDRWEVVRHADFRQTLASNQRLLFRELEPEATDEWKLYAILLHGQADPRIPAFADIVFPTRDCKGYAAPRIRLFDEFAEVVLAKTSFAEEIIPDEITPVLRNDVPKVSEDE
jgi:hypothetical protein